MPDTSLVPYAGGASLGLLGIVIGWFQARRKADVDESANVLTAWKNLMESTEKRVSSLVAEVESLRNRLSIAENRIAELEGDLAEERQARRSLETENAGLKAAIAQNSRSAAYLLQPNTKVEEQAEKLNRAGDNIRKAGQ